MEQNYEALKEAINQLPNFSASENYWEQLEQELNKNVLTVSQETINVPHEVWEVIEQNLPGNTIQLPLEQMPKDIWRNLENNLNEELPNLNFTINKTNNKFKWSLGIAAASLLFTIGLGYLMFKPKNNPYYSFKNNKQVVLEDGTIISNTKNALVNFPEHFSKETRTMEQKSGTAFYEVAKNAEKPFIIKTPIAQIMVLGTSFTTKVTTDSLLVAVTTGKVKVNNNYKDVILLPNDTVIFYAANKAPTIKKKMVLIEFNNEPLINIIKSLQTKNELNVKFEENSIKNKLITVKFNNTDDSILLLSICEASGLELLEENNCYYIK